MALKPEDRYASPKLLADEIERWLADEPVTAWPEPVAARARRWMRRNRTIVTAAAVMVIVGLVALGIAYRRESAINARLARSNRQLDEANRQVRAANAELVVSNARVRRSKSESDRRLDQTLQAFEDYYTGVGEEISLGQKEFQSLRDRLLEKPRQFHIRGYTQRQVGDPKAAAESHRQAASIFSRLVSEQPDVTMYQDGLAKSYYNLDIVRGISGDRKGQLASYGEALAIRSKLDVGYPGVPEYQRGLAESYGSMARLKHDTGNLHEAEAPHRRAIESWSKLVSDRPERADYQEGLARCANDLGLLRAEVRNREGAEASFRRAIASWTKLEAAHSGPPRYQHQLGGSYNNLAIVQRERGEPK